MAAEQFYLAQGYTPTFKTVSFNGAGTVTVWTPRSSTKIVLTKLSVATTLAGTTAFYFGNLAGEKIVQFTNAGSGYIEADILADSNTYDRTLVGNSSGMGTDGVKVTAYGFEIPT